MAKRELLLWGRGDYYRLDVDEKSTPSIPAGDRAWRAFLDFAPEEAQLYDTFYGDVPLSMAQGVGVAGGGQSPFWQTVGGYPTTEHQPVAGGQPSSFWQTVTGGVR